MKIQLTPRPAKMGHLSSLLSVSVCLCGLILSPGCACPHRLAETTHSVKIYQNRDDGLVWCEEWKDAEGGGGIFWFADASIQSTLAVHTNQTALGGASWFALGQASITVNTNLPAVLGAAGTAAGNIIGAAAKTAVK